MFAVLSVLHLEEMLSHRMSSSVMSASGACDEVSSWECTIPRDVENLSKWKRVAPLGFIILQSSEEPTCWSGPCIHLTQ